MKCIGLADNMLTKQLRTLQMVDIGLTKNYKSNIICNSYTTILTSHSIYTDQLAQMYQATAEFSTSVYVWIY